MNSAGAVGTSGITRSWSSGSIAHHKCEEQSFARCVRVSQWLQESTSGARSREVAPVAAGEADGDLAKGQSKAKRRREQVPRGDTWYAQRVRERLLVGSRRSVLWKSEAFHGAKAEAALARWQTWRDGQGRHRATRASEVGISGE